MDDLDDRTRALEAALDPCVLPGVFPVARPDGRSFTRLTRVLRPVEAPFGRLDLPIVSLDGVRGELAIDQGEVVQLGRERCREILRPGRSFAIKLP